MFGAVVLAAMSVLVHAQAPGPGGQYRAAADAAAIGAASQRALLDQYCVTCHNDRLKTAQLSLEKLDLAGVGDHPELWEKVVRKLRAGVMPPPDVRRPPLAEYEALRDWLEDGHRSQGSTRVNPGAVVLHRLNRTEYTNAVRDLLDLDIDAATLLPPDDSAQGLRQHRRLADDFPDAARILYDGGGAGRAHGGRLLEDADRGDIPGAGRHVAEPARRRTAVRHARRDAGAPRLPGRRRIQVLDSELRDRQLHSRRAARTRHRRRARPSLQVSGRRAEPGHVRRGRRIARRDDSGESGFARGGRDVSGHELPAQPRHDPSVRSQVAREQQHSAAAVLPGDRVPAHPGSVQRAAPGRFAQPAQDPHLPPGRQRGERTRMRANLSSRRWRGARIAGRRPRRTSTR